MTALWPRNLVQRYQRGLRDLPRENGFEPLRVEITLPQSLQTTLYMSGPRLF